MKKLSSKNLKQRVESGWVIEKIEKPKPKKQPKPMLREVISNSSAETSKAIENMTESLRSLFEENLKNITTKNEVGHSKKKWKFIVNRNKNGFIENVIAEEI